MRFSLYLCFAVLSSGVNLLTQWLLMSNLAGRYAFGVALIGGTATGWIVKYLLDKRVVFRHRSEGNLQLAENMATHAGAGVFTTLLFWIIEIVFHLFVPLDGAMYIGAALGLAISYTVRYQIDRLYVFHPDRQGMVGKWLRMRLASQQSVQSAR